MMKFRLYIIITISCHIFSSCNKAVNPTPNPTNEVRVYHGDIYIACDNSPQYLFSLDSLIMNCNAADTLGLSFPMGIQTYTSTCTYDGNPELATSVSEYDFSVSRIDMQPTFTNSEIELIPIPFVILYGDTLSTSSPPFYSAYEANWTDNRLELYIYNAYVGGCLHDMVVWRLFR